MAFFVCFQVFGQVTLTFRYGREDEEVMGLKFCNEAIMCLAQLYPIHEKAVVEPNTPLQVSSNFLITNSFLFIIIFLPVF